MKRIFTLLLLAVAYGAAALFGATVSYASSHSEAPGTSKDRLADDTDLYAWVAADAPDAVTFVGNWIPLLEPNSGPNFASFDDEAHYYINVDNVGDSRKHLRFELTFNTTRQNDNTFLYNTGVVTSLTDPDLNVRQTWTLKRINVDTNQETVLGSGAVAPWNVGTVSMPDYAALAQSAIQSLPGGYKVFVGPRDDPFFVDLAAVFDLLNLRPAARERGSDKGLSAAFERQRMIRPSNGTTAADGLAGFNVMSVVLQVPKSLLTKDGTAPDAARSNNILGIWDTAERQTTRILNGDGTVTLSGPSTQVSRLGMPLVNEIVIPLGKKNFFNTTEPANDVANFGAFVVDPEPARLLTALFGIAVPPAPRNDLVAVFATGVPGLNQPAGVAPGEMLRLNMSIAPAAKPNPMGVLAGDVAGFPNGRRLGDDIVDIELRVVAGALVDGFNVAPNNQLSDGVDSNDRPFLPYFPYVSLPHEPRNHTHQAATSARESDDRGRDHGASSLDAGEASAQASTESGDVRSALRLSSANPGSGAILEYSLANRGRVGVNIYDTQGRVVRTLVDQDAAPGTFRAVWDGRDAQGSTTSRGMFFARLTVDGRTLETRKVVLQ